MNNCGPLKFAVIEIDWIVKDLHPGNDGRMRVATTLIQLSMAFDMYTEQAHNNQQRLKYILKNVLSEPSSDLT